MQTLEQKYGIPSFETCKKLSEYCKEKTLFTIYNILTNEICLTSVYELDINFIKKHGVYYKAPQIHELLELLPNTITYENYFYDLEIRKGYVFYSGLNRDIFEFENDNLAECLAQLYLTLKEKKLL